MLEPFWFCLVAMIIDMSKNIKSIFNEHSNIENKTDISSYVSIYFSAYLYFRITYGLPA